MRIIRAAHDTVEDFDTRTAAAVCVPRRSSRAEDGSPSPILNSRKIRTVLGFLRSAGRWRTHGGRKQAGLDAELPNIDFSQSFVLGGEEQGLSNQRAGATEGLAIIGRAADANCVPRRPARREHQLADNLRHMCRGQGQKITHEAEDLILRNARNDNDIVVAPDICRKPSEIAPIYFVQDAPRIWFRERLPARKKSRSNVAVSPTTLHFEGNRRRQPQ